MGFTTVNFILCFTIFVLLFYMVKGKKRQYVLLGANLLFAWTFSVEALVAILLIALLTWVSAGLISRINRKRIVLIVHVLLIVIMLVAVRTSWYENLESIVVPIGLSFYSLQSIAYVADIYSGKVGVDSLLNILIYLSFFPTVTSGPILRYGEFENELNINLTETRSSFDRIVNGLIYMLYGYFLKCMIAERIVNVVNSLYDNPSGYSSAVLLLGIIGYSIQLYADFAGYSAIVIGAAQVMGFDLPDNFVAPYLAISIKEFWGRWHTSLSGWLKDYIYIPLGGNRKGRLRKAFNLMVTFFISGLWHGAGKRYMLWGGLHGTYNVLEDSLRHIVDSATEFFERHRLLVLWNMCRRLFVFLIVTIAWIPFRMSLADILELGHAIVVNHGSVASGFRQLLDVFDKIEWAILLYAIAIMVLTDVMTYRTRLHIGEYLDRKPLVVKSAVIGTMLLTMLIFGVWGDVGNATSFVYTGF